ncbi:MAG: sigma 54-interacting transcriptional regulator, partial [Carboxylicivirga sp.]|nr:sigma 54-interacting transcriptional regulator [Carboxylicivirga sp.]
SSKVLKTDVRVVAATNVNMEKAIKEGKFREDLFYRLNSVPINIPPLRDRSDDIYLLFRKFANDFATRYRMPAIRLSDDAKDLLLRYRWPGNIRQLKNITEQISVIEQQREINGEAISKYLPFHSGDNLPAVITNQKQPESDFSNEREILYKVLFDMKNDMNDLKKLVLDMMENGRVNAEGEHAQIIQKLYQSEDGDYVASNNNVQPMTYSSPIKEEHHDSIQDTEEFVEESLSLADKEIELIRKALDKYNGRRKQAAVELGISERTLYRKIKEYQIER